MLETEFLFFQGMKKRIDQRIKDLNKKLNGSHPKRKSFIQQNLPCKKDSIVHGKR